MAEGQVDLGVGVGLGGSVSELNALTASLNKAVKEAAELQKRLTLKVAIDSKGFDALQQSINKLNQLANGKGGLKAVSNELRAENLRSSDDRAAKATGDFTKRQIGRINADLDNVVSQVLDHFTKSVERRLRTSFDSIEARLNQSLTKQLTQVGLYGGRSQESLQGEASANTTLGRQQLQRRLVRASTVSGLSDDQLAAIEDNRLTKRASADRENETRDRRRVTTQIIAEKENELRELKRASIVVRAEIDNETRDRRGVRTQVIAEKQNELKDISRARLITRAEIDNENRDTARSRLITKAEYENAARDSKAPRTPRTLESRVNDINDVVQQRLTQNGGADFIKIQGQILANYTLLSTAFNAFKSTITNVVELEKELKQFAAITQTTDTEMKPFEQTLLKIASGSKFTATEVAQAATIMGQAGLSAKQVTDSLQAVINLATASGSTLKESVDLITSSLTVFNLNATEAGRVANILTSGLNLSKLSIDKLALGIQYAGNIAADAGLSLSELTAVLAGLANSGIRSGSTLGTGIRQLLLELLNPTEKAKEVFKDLKISLADVDIRANGLAGVLENLRLKGFTTADAMRAFETRTVAAFSAASRSIDTIKSMEAQLLLTSAATEGAAKQMTSLANTWARFVSSFTGAAYTGLKPTMDVLTQILGSAGSAIGLLNQIPAVTTVVGTAFAGLAGTAAVAWTARMILGLVGINTQLSLMSVSLPRYAASMGLFAAATGTATTATTVLGAALRFLAANPIILGITAVAGIYGLVKAFSDWSDQLDKVNAKLNESKGRQQQTQTTVDGLTESIDKLYRRQEQLKKDPVLLRNAILEARQAFGQYGLQLDENTTSVEQLIAAHKRLRDIKLQTIPGELGSQLKTEQDKLKIQTDQLNSTSSQRQLKIALTDLVGGNAVSAPRRAREQVGPAGEDAARLILNPTKASLAQVQNAAGGLAVTSGELRGQINKLDPASPEVKVLEKKIETIAQIVALLRKLEGSLGGIEATKLSIEDTGRQQKVADIQALQGPDSYSELRNQFQGAEGAQRNRLEGILKGNLDSKEGLGQFRIAQGEATVEANNLKNKVDALKDRLKGQGFSDSEISKALEGLYTSVASLNNLFLTQIKDTQSAYNEAAKSVNEYEQKRISSQLKEIEKKSTIAKDESSLGKLQELYVQKFAELEKNAYDEAERESAGDPKKFQKLWDEKRQQLAADKERALQGFATRNEKVLKDAFNGLIDEIDAEIKSLSKQILELRNRIKDQKLTGAPADEVLKQIDEKQNKISVLETNKSSVNQTVSRIGTDAAAPVDLKVDVPSLIQSAVTKAAEAGISTRYALTSLGVESNYGQNTNLGKIDPKTGKEFTYQGAYQFSQKSLNAALGRDGDLANLDDQIEAFVKNTQKNAEALKKSGLGSTDFNLYLAHQQGIAGAPALLNADKSSSAVDAIAPFYKNRETAQSAITGNSGLGADATVGQFLTAVEKYYRTREAQSAGFEKPKSKEEADRLEGRQADLRRQKADATDDVVKNLNAQLSTVEKNTSTASAKTLTQSHALNSDQILETTIPTIKKAYDELEQKSTSIIKEEIVRRQAIGEQTADLDTKLADKQTEIGAKRQAALSTAFEAYERQAKEEAGKDVKNKEAELSRLRNAGETVDDNRINQAQLALDRAKTAQAQRELEVAKVKEGLASTESGSVGERSTGQRVAIEQQLDQVLQQKLALEQQGITTGTEYEAIKARETQLARDLEGARANEKTGTQEAADAAARLAAAHTQTAEASTKAASALTATASSASQVASGQVNSWMKSNNLTDKNGNALGLDVQLAKQTQGLLTGISGALSTFISNLAMGKASLKDFGVSILKVFLDTFSKMAANNLIGAFTGSLGGGAGGGLGSLFKANGGRIYRRAGGGRSPAPFRDSVHAMLMPDEFVMKSSAARAIGYDRLDAMNNMGPAAMSKSGVRPLQQIMKKDPDQFNVWMVDKENLPQPGPRDFVAAIGDNIIRGGELKQLIKTVQIGGI